MTPGAAVTYLTSPAPVATYAAAPAVQQPVTTLMGSVGTTLRSLGPTTLARTGVAAAGSCPYPPVKFNDPKNLLAAGDVISERDVTREELAAEGRFIEAEAESKPASVFASRTLAAPMPVMTSMQAAPIMSSAVPTTTAYAPVVTAAPSVVYTTVPATMAATAPATMLPGTVMVP
eukprot:CAMPEP_0115271680 /NCGR_PEP_ID=MMETSP0270-20121206/54228_1 /TAXON_ID=71861 /ORGANISM="Scrippsiella trochoidea, Strain CCMP3099" /LENGTH=174 /DNA_ID=CAMNT_0002688055 /DNA_START=86 /DNA_END=610 /DNA_ORIENTATION=+